MNPGADLIAARALLYVSVLVAFGVPAYLACTPGTARLWLEERRRIWRFAAIAAGAGIAATLIHLLLLCAAMNAVAAAHVGSAMLRFVATEMPVGRAGMVRAAALALLLVATFALRGGVRIAVGAACGAVALSSLAWNGHAMMNEGGAGWVHLISDQVHLLAAGVWIGALVALLTLARAEGEHGAVARAEAFAGFSFVGTVVVAVLVLTGVINSIMILVVAEGGAPSCSYLVALGVKLVLFLGALALAANNRFRLTPALSRPGVAAKLRRSVLIELSLVVAAVLIVALLGLLSPTQ